MNTQKYEDTAKKTHNEKEALKKDENKSGTAQNVEKIPTSTPTKPLKDTPHK